MLLQASSSATLPRYAKSCFWCNSLASVSKLCNPPAPARNLAIVCGGVTRAPGSNGRRSRQDRSRSADVQARNLQPLPGCICVDAFSRLVDAVGRDKKCDHHVVKILMFQLNNDSSDNLKARSVVHPIHFKKRKSFCVVISLASTGPRPPRSQPPVPVRVCKAGHRRSFQRLVKHVPQQVP